MAVDYQQTLNPASGLARNVRILRPDGTNSFLWTVAVDIGQERPDSTDDGIDMSWVGAAGIRRGPTLARAAGEAVERSALIPGARLESGAELPPAPRGACWADTSAVPGMASYAAMRHEPDGTYKPVAVPAGAVDFPPEPHTAHGFFDPGPSGTAAGIDRSMAANSAAKELIERDAAMRAWDNPRTAVRYTLRGHEFGSQVHDLAAAARGEGVEVDLILIRESPPVWMVVAIDIRKEVVGAGLGLECDPAHGVLRALQESLQIRSLLINLKDLAGGGPVARPITNEVARARYWAADNSVAAIQGWLRRIPRTMESAASESSTPEQPGLWLESLQGYTLVDLTPRLPAAIRTMGWQAVKLFSDTLQPLRMSDALGWNMLHGPARTAGEPVNALPHPFI